MPYYVVQHCYPAECMPPRWHTSEVVDELADGDFVNAGPFDTLDQAQAAIWPALGLPFKWWPDYARSDVLPAGTVIRQPHGPRAVYLGDTLWQGVNP